MPKSCADTVTLVLANYVHMFGAVVSPILQLYTHVDRKIVSTLDYRHHNMYIRRSYIRIKDTCCQPLFFLRYKPTRKSTMGTFNSSFYLHLLASVSS